MATLYFIPNWEQDCENSKSRQVENATFFVTSNNFDGRKMKRLKKLNNPLELYGALTAIRGIASRSPYRGVLLDDRGAPLSANDIAEMTGFPVKGVDRALKELSSDPINILGKDEIEEKNGEWTLPDTLRRTVLHRSARRRTVSAGVPPGPAVSAGVAPGPAVSADDTEGHEPAPTEVSQNDTSSAEKPVVSHGVGSRHEPTPSDTERHGATRTEQKGREGKFPPTVPQGGQEGGIAFNEAKQFLHDLFRREKRKWSYEEDELLSKICPIPRHHLELIKAWVLLPLDHEIFDPNSRPHTQKKQGLSSFLRDYNNELDKMQQFAPRFVTVGANGAKKIFEPPRWREFFEWKYPGSNIPSAWTDLGRDQREEYKRDFETFEKATAEAALL